MSEASSRSFRPLGAIVCFFRNHDVTPDYQRLVWTCDRCGSEGPKLWMTGAWFMDWLRGRQPRTWSGYRW